MIFLSIYKLYFIINNKFRLEIAFSLIIHLLSTINYLPVNPKAFIIGGKGTNYIIRSRFNNWYL